MTMPNDADMMRGLDRVYAAVAGILDDDLAATGRALTDLTEMGMGYLFSACGMWAAMFNEASQSGPCTCGGAAAADDDDTRVILDADGDAFVGMQFINARTGDTVNPDQLPDELQPAVWATRYITATANGDLLGMHALFKSAGPELLGEGILALVKLAATAVAHARSGT